MYSTRLIWEDVYKEWTFLMSTRSYETEADSQPSLKTEETKYQQSNITMRSISERSRSTSSQKKTKKTATNRWEVVIKNENENER